MARRSDHTRDQLKEMILKTAWGVVGCEGFENLSARRIAGDIGYAPGTIYNIFKSMDDLCLQVNGQTLDLLYGVLNSPDCKDPKKTPIQNMKKMSERYMTFAHEYRPYWLMLFSHRMPEGRKLDAEYQEKIDRLFYPLEELLRPLFSEKQNQKRKMAARVLWSSVHGLCFLQETGKIHIVGSKEPMNMADYLIDTFVSGIKNYERMSRSCKRVLPPPAS